MSTTGCLITSTPQFKERQHTAPFLVESTADPSPLAVVVIDSADTGTKTFSADVISQDDSVESGSKFSNVQPYLLIDYGIQVAPGMPSRWFIAGASLGPGTLDQTTGRHVSVNWNWAQGYPVDPGCHTATLMVSHDVDRVTGCPTCSSDYSMITWQVLRCDKSTPGSCDGLPIEVGATCPLQPDQGKGYFCQQALADLGVASSCPAAADGGAP